MVFFLFFFRRIGLEWDEHVVFVYISYPWHQFIDGGYYKSRWLSICVHLYREGN